MEIGFYNDISGYWQAIAGNAEELLATYPEGTIIVPIKPETNCELIDGQWVPIAPAPTSKEELLAYAAERRRVLANASTVVTVGGVDIPVWSDTASTGSITSLVVAASILPTLATEWKGADGEFYPLDAAGMQVLAFGMLAHVNACFQFEKALKSQIDVGTITTLAQIDAATL